MAYSVSISMASSKYTWDDVDKRAEELRLDRSKYSQMLYELDLDYKLLSNPIVLDWIRKGRKNTTRFIDILILLFAVGIFLLILCSILLWR